MSCFVACQLYQRGEGFLAKLGAPPTATAPEWTDAGFRTETVPFREGRRYRPFPVYFMADNDDNVAIAKGDPKGERREGGICSVAGAAASAAVLVLRVFLSE